MALCLTSGLILQSVAKRELFLELNTNAERQAKAMVSLHRIIYNYNRTCCGIIPCTNVALSPYTTAIARSQVGVNTEVVVPESRSEQTQAGSYSQQVEVSRRVEWSCIVNTYYIPCQIPVVEFLNVLLIAKASAKTASTSNNSMLKKPRILPVFLTSMVS